MTALHWAAFHGNIESVRVLCELGADVTLEDFRNRTAIEIVAVSHLVTNCDAIVSVNNTDLVTSQYRRLNDKERPMYDECLKYLKIRLLDQVNPQHALICKTEQRTYTE
jgi:ankyrin repeat protein